MAETESVFDKLSAQQSLDQETLSKIKTLSTNKEAIAAFAIYNDVISNAFKSGIEKYGINGEAVAAEIKKSLAQVSPDAKNPTEFFRDYLRFDATGALLNNLSLTPFVNMLIAAAVQVVYAISAPIAIAEIAHQKSKQEMARMLRPTLLDVDTLAKCHFRKLLTEGELYNQYTSQGLPDNLLAALRDSARIIPDFDIIRRNFLRGNISEEEKDRQLDALGISSELRAGFNKLIYDLPSISDFVLFAVRDVYNEEFIAQSGALENMPEQFIEDAKTAGLSPDDAKKYWASHWKPPSTSEVFEMYHRQVIDEQELDLLLKINDILPGYRDKLKQIAYLPIPRVDIRRMYDEGYIDFDRVVKAYRDNGYSPEDSLLMARWTAGHYGQESKDRTKGDILKLYEIGQYTFEQTITELKALKYPEDIALELILRVDFAKAEKSKKNGITVIKHKFIKLLITDEEAMSALLALAATEDEAAGLIDDWKTERFTKESKLTKADIDKMLKSGVMSLDDYIEYLAILGYTDRDITLLVNLHNTTLEEQAE